MDRINGLLTVQEASKQIGLTKSAVWKRIYKNRINTVRIGNIALVRLEDVKNAAQALG